MASFHRLAVDYPHFYRFARGRFDRKKFQGLALTLLIISFIAALALFLGTMEGVINSESIVRMDRQVANYMHMIRTEPWITFFLWMTLWGKWQVATAAGACFVGSLLVWGKRRYLVPFAVCLAGAEVFVGITKATVERSRPELAYYIEQSYSFPSGHAALAMALYGFAAYVLIRNARTWGSRTAVLIGAFAFAGLLGLSRLYLGVHFLSDVWGGYLLGAMWLVVGICLSEILALRPRHPKLLENTRPNASPLVWTSALLILLGLFYVLFSLQYQPPRGNPSQEPDTYLT